MGMTPTAVVGGPTGYSLVLPPGWRQIPLGDGAAGAVRELVDRAFADSPADVPPDTLAALRRRLEGHLLSTITAARRTGGTELYVPTERMGGLLVPASFVVGETELAGAAPAADGGEDVVAQTLARLAATSDDARVLEIAEAPALRSARASASQPESQLGIDAAPRHVDYLLPVPGRPGRWLTVSYTVLEVADAPEITDLLVELFDALMTTFRWTSA